MKGPNHLFQPKILINAGHADTNATVSIIKMNRKTISIILLAIIIVTAGLGLINSFTGSSDSISNDSGTLQITDSKTNQTETVKYESSGECLRVIDGDTIWVYGVGDVRLVQVDTPEKGEIGYDDAKKFVEDHCRGKTVYLDIDDKEPEDKYGRKLAIVYTNSEDINRELLNNGLAKELYIPPSEFEKGEI